MLLTPLSIFTDVRPLQPENAEAPMLVTDDGIVTDVRLLQPSNAESLMLVEPFATVTLVMDEYASGKTEDKEKLPGTTALLMPPQSSNASYPMLVTEAGIVTEVRPLQPENA